MANKTAQRVLSAPANGCYNFQNWSDGGAASHAITVPATKVTYTARFVLNGTCPETSFTKRPAKTTRKHRAKLEFVSSVKPATFACKLDDSDYSPCASSVGLEHLQPGKHVMRVKAISGDLEEPKPAKASWKVIRT